jgi:hypothetical protein
VRLPTPEPGLVLQYAFLWRREFEAGQDEGRKDRPCTVVLATPSVLGGLQVYVLPVTHSPPSDPSVAMEIPQRIKAQLGLDGERSWIILDEVNDFFWPGFDLRAVPGAGPARVDYGVLPPRFFDEVRAAFLTLARRRVLKRSPRS